MKKLILYLSISLVILVLIMEYGINSLIINLFEERIKNYYGSMFEGFVSVIINDLDQMPEKKWPDYMKSIQKNFPYPVTVKKANDLAISKFEKKILSTGEILVLYDDDIFRKKVGSTQWVLTIGPMPDLDISTLIDILVYFLALLLVLLFSFIWTMVFWRNLRKISNTATLLGKGNLNARIHVSGWSYFIPIASAFNKMAERIKALIESHKELTNGVAHELKTPLSRIRFELEAANTASSREELQMHLEGINTDINELDELTSELLSYARFDRKELVLNLKDQSLYDWFGRYRNTFRKEKSVVELFFSADKALKKPRAKMDGKLIERALSNIVYNALKHAEEKAIVHLSGDSDYFFFSVEDDGPGIPKENREKVFTPFTRLDNSRNRDTGGYGLGLAIAHKIIAMHSGSITVNESSLGGAQFVLKIPRQ